VSLLDRIIDGLHGLFYNQKRSVSLGSRFLAIVVALVTVASVFPTLAEELTPIPEVTEAPTSTSELTQSPDPTPSETASSSTPSDSEPEPEPEPSPTETEPPKTEVAEFQPRINYRFPNSIAVDPRASITTLPQISMSGGGIGLVCIFSNGFIDLANKNMVNNVDEGELLVAGDLTQQVRISGSMNVISALINSGGGLRIMAGSSRLARASVTFTYVELTQPDVSSEFCGAASSQRSISFRALDLRMENAKGRIDFNKPSGK
jgi:hypothetical protein